MDLPSKSNEDALLDAKTAPPAAIVPAACASALPQPGDRLDEYEIVSEIARGAMGVVYRARQEALARDVAIKMVTCELNEATRQRFDREAKAAAVLDHPGIVAVYETGSYAGRPYFVMPLIEGQSLAEMLRDKPLSPQHAATLVRDTAVAVSFAHEKHIIHRDLKPANVLVGADGKPRVADFGVCKVLEHQAEATAVGELIGTPQYMPPEQARGEAATFASDVYSLGAVLYSTLSGRPPFQAANPVDVVAQVIQTMPISLRRLDPSIPPELETIVFTCLQKQPADRYVSAQAMAEDLTRFVNHEPIHAKPPGLARRVQHFIRQHILVASVSGSAALLLVLATAALVVALVRTRSRLMEATDLLHRERMNAVEFTRMNAQANRDRAAVSRLESRRLSAAATLLRTTNPDAALQLALASIDAAQSQGAPPEDAAVDIIRKAIGDTDGRQANPPMRKQRSIDELITAGKGAIRQPLTAHQRALYGLKPAEELQSPDRRPNN